MSSGWKLKDKFASFSARCVHRSVKTRLVSLARQRFRSAFLAMLCRSIVSYLKLQLLVSTLE